MPEGTARTSLINYLVEAAFGLGALGSLRAAMIVAIDAVFGGGGALLGAGFVLGEVCTVLFISEASPRASVSPAFVHSFSG